MPGSSQLFALCVRALRQKFRVPNSARPAIYLRSTFAMNGGSPRKSSRLMIATRDAGSEPLLRSFRDPSGAVIRYRGRILRTVKPEGTADLEGFLSTRTAREVFRHLAARWIDVFSGGPRGHPNRSPARSSDATHRFLVCKREYDAISCDNLTQLWTLGGVGPPLAGAVV